MICGTCGRHNPAHLVFCQECGQRLAARVAPPTPPVGATSPSNPAPPPATAGQLKTAPHPAVQPPPPAKPPGASEIACPSCGAPNAASLRYCMTCGTRLAKGENGVAHETPTSPPPAEAAPIAPARVVALGPPASEVATRTCARCRGQNDPAAQFCKYCGSPLGEPAAPSPPSPTIPEPEAATAPPAPPAPMPEPPPPPAVAVAIPTPPTTPAADVVSSEPTKPTPEPRREPVAVVEPKPEAPPVTAHMEPSPNANVRGRLVIIARDGGEGPSYPFHDVADIGRAEGHIVIADDRYISPRHARLTRRGDHVYLRDLGSVNGVYLRIPTGLGAGAAAGVGIAGEVPGASGAGAGPGLSPSSGTADTTSPAVVLQDQDLFLVGQQVLMFEAVKDVDEGFGAASQHGTLLFGTPVTPRYARLSQRTVEGVARDVFYIRKAETVLGRETGDIVFTDDPFLSRRHAIVRMTTTEPASRGGKPTRRFTLADLGSSNGTFLKIREEVRLSDGDHFRIGQQLFRVDLDVARRSPVAPAGRGT